MHTYQKALVSVGASSVEKGQALFLDNSAADGSVISNEHATFVAEDDIVFVGIAVQDADAGEECYFAPPGGEIECLIRCSVNETWSGGEIIYMDRGAAGAGAKALTNAYPAVPVGAVVALARISLAKDANGDLITAGPGNVNPEYVHCRVLDGLTH